MNDSGNNVERLMELAGAVCNQTASASDTAELNAMIRNDPESCERYLQYCQMHIALRMELRADLAAQSACRQTEETSFTGDSSSPPVSEAHVASYPPFAVLGNLIHGTVGFFSQEVPFSLLIASVITCLGLLAGSMVYVSRPQPMARGARPSISTFAESVPERDRVGRITGMVDCRWTGSGVRGREAEKDNSTSLVALGDKLVLASGLLEITYDTGAKVILQGPVAYEVDSRDGGYLSIGKLTAQLDNAKSKAANRTSSLSTIHYPLFTIKTPTATVTDLGTEFGVEVTREGSTNSYVFQGRIAVEANTSRSATPHKIELTAGESASVALSGEIVPTRRKLTAASTVKFVRTIAHAKSLIAYWPMDEGRGRGAFDKSGNNINCWFTGEPAWTEGRFGRAVQLLGDGQYLSAVKDSKLDLGTGDFTVSLWFKGGSVKNWRWLLNYNGEGTESAPGLVITTYIPDGKTDSHLRASLGEWFTDVYHHLESTVTANSNTNWYHVALTRNGTTLTGYVNGKQAFAESVPIINLVSNSDNNGDLLLGTRLTSGPYYRGALDDVAIWNRALTVLQIQSLADGKATPLNVLNVESTPLEINKPHSEVHP